MVEPGGVIERVVFKVNYIIIVIDCPFCVAGIRIFGIESVQDGFRRFDAARYVFVVLLQPAKSRANPTKIVKTEILVFIFIVLICYE